MQTNTEKWPGRLTLMVAHCAGMVDLVALPVWVGTLISQYKFNPQQAGGLATLFLAGAVLSSLFFAPRFRAMNARMSAAAGFALAAIFFGAAAFTRDYAVLGALHALAGASAGCALSFTHGTIGRCANPHRLFAMAGLALGIFAILFLGLTPNLVAAFGGAMLFKVFAGVMAIPAIISAVAFPAATLMKSGTPLELVQESGRPLRLSFAVWAGIGGIALMALNQAMIFSFVERIGIDRGYGVEAVTGVLIALGFVSLLPAPLAAVLERKIPAYRVVLAGPALQAAVTIAVVSSQTFLMFALPVSVFAAIMIFTHTFAFGLLSRLDRTARALAGTPAMLMAGAAIGPILGGTLVNAFGYGSLGIATTLTGLLAIVSFSLARPAIPAAQSGLAHVNE